MNEKISKIKLELLKEEFNKQIKDSYILNLSMVLLDEFENLKIENNQLKENYERTYNENRALRQKQYITDTDLIYENYILNRAINKAIEYMKDYIFEPLLTNEDRKLIMYNDNLRNFEKILKGVE